MKLTNLEQNTITEAVKQDVMANKGLNMTLAYVARIKTQTRVETLKEAIKIVRQQLTKADRDEVARMEIVRIMLINLLNEKP